LSELKALSPQLYQFAAELNNKKQKLEAIIDVQGEDHQDKYTRLFYKIIGQNVRKEPLSRVEHTKASHDTHNSARNHQNKVKFDMNKQ
jgi:hypothetical protein